VEKRVPNYNYDLANELLMSDILNISVELLAKKE
jgi:hypothetical protein